MVAYTIQSVEGNTHGRTGYAHAPCGNSPTKVRERIATIIQFAMFTQATNITTIPPQVIEDNSSYAWSSWGSWSPCSRSCGVGVAVQERQCLPRSRILATNATTTPAIIVRVTRQTQSDCLGVAKRYHECNTAPCSGSVQDMRSEQCAAYDRRPFRGRFYTWVPYIDGNSPCTLNCRPLGQHFYASLALVADGTPCTRPGFRAICVQGACKPHMEYCSGLEHPNNSILHLTAFNVEQLALSSIWNYPMDLTTWLSGQGLYDRKFLKNPPDKLEI
ncbi:papilin-like [Aphomia sociella]